MFTLAKSEGGRQLLQHCQCTRSSAHTTVQSIDACRTRLLVNTLLWRLTPLYRDALSRRAVVPSILARLPESDAVRRARSLGPFLSQSRDQSNARDCRMSARQAGPGRDADEIMKCAPAEDLTPAAPSPPSALELVSSSRQLHADLFRPRCPYSLPLLRVTRPNRLVGGVRAVVVRVLLESQSAVAA